MPHHDARLALIHTWLTQDLGLHPQRLEPASNDASFRRYFRAFIGERTLVIMDAPPEKEDVRPYLNVSRLLEGVGVHVPHVHEADTTRGLLLLEDLGSTQYLARLHGARVHRPDEIELWAVDRAVLSVLVAQLDRRVAFSLAVTDRELFVAIGSTTITGPLTRHRLG